MNTIETHKRYFKKALEDGSRTSGWDDVGSGSGTWGDDSKYQYTGEASVFHSTLITATVILNDVLNEVPNHLFQKGIRRDMVEFRKALREIRKQMERLQHGKIIRFKWKLADDHFGRGRSSIIPLLREDIKAMNMDMSGRRRNQRAYKSYRDMFKKLNVELSELQKAYTSYKNSLDMN